jgi:predicted transcriptional regulator
MKVDMDNQSLEQIRWQQTLEALESVAKGEIILAEEFGRWVKSWGFENELPKPFANRKTS